MLNLQENELLIRCQCGSKSHFAFLTHDPWEQHDNNLKGSQDDWYLTVSLEPLGFWKRLYRGLGYIFLPNHLWWMYTDIVLTNEDAAEIEAFISARLAKVS
jgi:hypothetical protein